MAYSPENNPYIPGDPYSYDLKWIVNKLKEVISMYAPLSADFAELKEYVENYFANLDVTDEINAKLNQMYADGTISSIIDAIFTDLDNKISTQNANIAVLIARMDAFTALTNASTTGDAELQDIRIGANGQTWPTAGDAVRGQIDDILNITNDIALSRLTGSYFDFTPYISRPLYGTTSLFANAYSTFDIDISGLDLAGKQVSTFLWVDNNTSYLAGFILEEQYDSNNQKIYPSSGYHYLGHPMTIQPGCTTIRLTSTNNAYHNYQNSTLAHAQLYTTGNEQVNYGSAYIPVSNRWKNKKWVAYGDSIVQQNLWQPYVQNQFGFNLINVGLGGSSVADNNDAQIATFTDPTRIAAIPSDADIVTIMGGTNDFNGTNNGSGSPLGTLPTSGTFDTSTFIGALCQTVKLVQTQAPNAIIIIMGNVPGRGVSGVVGTYQIMNSQGLNSTDYAKAAEDVARYMGIPYIDTNGIGITPFNRTTYIQDSVHPNSAGGKLIAQKVIEFFNAYYPTL